MNAQATHTSPGKPLRSIGAVLLGFLATAVLSLGTDQLLHVLKFYPPWGQPMYDPVQNFTALAYRCVFAVMGGYITARFAPRNPMRHVLVLGVIGLIMGTAGAIATIPMNLGPAWYPIALALTALPCVWAGGVLHRRQQSRTG